MALAKNAPKKLGVAVVGCGCVAGYGHLPALTESGQWQVKAYVDTDLARAEDFRRRFGDGDVYRDYRHVLDRKDVDVVAVLTMPTKHHRIAIDALEAGKHVFTEKPISDSVVSAEEIISAARRAHRKLFVGFLLRYTGVYRKMAEVIHAGRIGHPAVYRMFSFEHYARNDIFIWERAKNFMRDTSPAFDCGSHYVDLMRWFSRAEAVRVHGVGARINPEVPKGSFDWESLQIELSDGSRGIYEAGWGFSFPEKNSTHEAIGPEGRVCVRYAQAKEGEEAGAETVFLDLDEKEEVLESSEWKGFADEWAHFARVIHEDLDPYPMLADALASIRIVEAGHLSALKGRAFNLKKL